MTRRKLKKFSQLTKSSHRDLNSEQDLLRGQVLGEIPGRGNSMQKGTETLKDKDLLGQQVIQYC